MAAVKAKSRRRRKERLNKNDFVCLGVVTGAFGIQGEVRIKSHTDPPENIGAYGDLTADPGGTTLRLQSLRPIKNGLAAKFEGISDRDRAQALKGVRLNVARSALPETDDEDEFYWVDLLGCAATSQSGADLGVVRAVHDFGAGPVIEVGKEGETELYRFTKETVPVVDVTEKRVVIADDAIAATKEEK